LDISESYRQKGKDINRHPWEVTRAKIIYFLIKKHKNHFNNITDFGSGDIYVLQNLVQTKIASSYSAIDNAYTDDIISQLQTMPNTDVISFYTDLSQTGNSKSDFVLIADVLEHCEADRAILQQITSGEITTADSFFLITVPAFQKLFSQHDILLNHYRRYSRKEIKTICKKTQLEVLDTGYFFFSLLPVRIFHLLLEKLKLRKEKKSIDNWKGKKGLTKIISSILWADFRFSYALSSIGIHLPGLSCYCICKKSPS